jgi:hypothetical protein
MFNLLTSTGKVLSFRVRACADLYQRAYGGVVFTQQLLADELDIATSYDTMIPSNEKGTEYVYNL